MVGAVLGELVIWWIQFIKGEVNMTISKDDVLQDCSVCGGTGDEPKAPETSGGGHSYGQRPYTPATFDVPKCKACKGTRKQLTETGEAIKAVFDHLKELKNRG